MAATKTTNRVRQAPAHGVIQYDTQGFGNSGVIEAGAGRMLLSQWASNKGASALYLMVFDATAVPANNAVPVVQPLVVPASGQAFVDFTDRGGQGLAGLVLSTGLVWAVSTTQATLTVDASSSVWATLRYI